MRSMLLHAIKSHTDTVHTSVGCRRNAGSQLILSLRALLAVVQQLIVHHHVSWPVSLPL